MASATIRVILLVSPLAGTSGDVSVRDADLTSLVQTSVVGQADPRTNLASRRVELGSDKLMEAMLQGSVAYRALQASIREGSEAATACAKKQGATGKSAQDLEIARGCADDATKKKGIDAAFSGVTNNKTLLDAVHYLSFGKKHKRTSNATTSTPSPTPSGWPTNYTACLDVTGLHLTEGPLKTEVDFSDKLFPSTVHANEKCLYQSTGWCMSVLAWEFCTQTGVVYLEDESAGENFSEKITMLEYGLETGSSMFMDYGYYHKCSDFEGSTKGKMGGINLPKAAGVVQAANMNNEPWNWEMFNWGAYAYRQFLLNNPLGMELGCVEKFKSTNDGGQCNIFDQHWSAESVGWGSTSMPGIKVGGRSGGATCSTILVD